MKIGITGQRGFVGTHLTNNIKFLCEEFELVPYENKYFDEVDKLDLFISQCDVVVHLSGINRHSDEDFLYKKNIELTETLISSLIKSKNKTHLIFSSSTQESNSSAYGKSKLESRKKFLDWSKQYGNKFTGLIIPNLFGPFCKPNYNSVVATFCDKIINKGVPEVIDDKYIDLLYVQDLCLKIIDIIKLGITDPSLNIKYLKRIKVSDLLTKLNTFASQYIEFGNIPDLNNHFDISLFNTLRSCIEYKTFFPKQYNKHNDLRGSFFELIRTNSKGQFSFSDTYQNKIRGNHFHTRKIERFSVIRGKALIEIRRVDNDEKISLTIDGKSPSYVDMPIWYTHNIKNIGNTELITLFWINEPYNPEDADTYFVNV
ncbi:NAD-dependent epimerase/dehydratase family protein [Flavobacteriaceae bacterium]|nr:NAD-dependent epimerase/dehydratase family protein [Flavobacteriaceae bacterium]